MGKKVLLLFLVSVVALFWYNREGDEMAKKYDVVKKEVIVVLLEVEKENRITRNELMGIMDSLSTFRNDEVKLMQMRDSLVHLYYTDRSLLRYIKHRK